jgi:hypothetical protein
MQQKGVKKREYVYGFEREKRERKRNKERGRNVRE